MPSTGENQPSGSLGSSLEGGLTPPPLICWGSLLGALLYVTKHYIPSRVWVFFVWMPPSLAFLLAREGVPRFFFVEGFGWFERFTCPRYLPYSMVCTTVYTTPPRPILNAR